MKKFFVSVVFLFLAALLLTSCAPASVLEGSAPAVTEMVSSSLESRTFGVSFLLGILCLLAGVVLAGFFYFSESIEINQKARQAVAILVVIASIVLPASFGFLAEIDQGEVGVQIRMGEVYKTLSPGLNPILPYADRVVVFSVRDWTYATMGDPSLGSEDYRDVPVSVITKDGGQASLTFTVQGRIIPDKAAMLYERYGSLPMAITKLVKDTTRLIVREEIRGFSAETLYQSFDTVDGKVTERLAPIMEEGGLELVMFGFRKPTLGIGGDLEAQLNAALVAEQASKVALQQIAVKEAEARQAVASAEGNKQVAIKEAEARAAANLVEAEAQAKATVMEAEANAKANKEIAVSLSEILIEYLRTQKWDGKYPLYVGDLKNLFVPFSSATE